MNITFPPIRRVFTIIFSLLLVFIVGGLGGVYFDRELLPRLFTSPRLADWDFVKRLAENVTVIKRTEEVVIREDDAIERVVSQPATAVVNIVVASETTQPQTGVLLTNDGLVVTYAPIATPQAATTILLFDGTSHVARFVAADPLTGLVYYRIDGVNTPAIALSNSDDSRVGRKLIAIGNSAGEYQNRLSVGILGHKNRTFNLSGKTVASSEKWEGVFEMDMPQEREFVGGPVIGLNGEMVGLIGMVMLDQTEHFFLLPANAIRESLSLVLSSGSFSRPTLGVYYLPLTKALSIARGLPRDRGALVYSPSGKTGLALIAGSPAERAGLRYGDIIVAVDKKEINLDQPLSVLLGQHKKGDIIELLILRDERELSLSVAL